MLKIQNLHYAYGKKEVLKGISLEVLPQEIVGFIGHNGAGKTTTLRCISGIRKPLSGSIWIDGVDLARFPLEAKRKMAYLPDNPDLYDHLSGIAYLSMIADLYQVKDKRQERIDRLAADFEMKENLGALIGSYSHGMKQKLALMSAFLHEPKLLILDEPFVGLDPKAAYMLKQRMKMMCEQNGAIFFSTHVLEVAEKLCDRIIILRKGEIVAQGKTEELIKDQSLEEVFLELAEHA